jgi:hypothetical protein
MPIPSGAPNASPFIERLLRTLREEAWDPFIFLRAEPICPVVAESIRYDNGARPSQAIPDPYPELKEPPPAAGRLIALPDLGGLIHDHRLAA